MKEVWGTWGRQDVHDTFSGCVDSGARQRSLVAQQLARLRRAPLAFGYSMRQVVVIFQASREPGCFVRRRRSLDVLSAHNERGILKMPRLPVFGSGLMYHRLV
jgi:hypothetical protein